MLMKRKPFASLQLQQGNVKLDSDPFLLPAQPGDKTELYINVSNAKLWLGGSDLIPPLSFFIFKLSMTEISVEDILSWT